MEPSPDPTLPMPTPEQVLGWIAASGGTWFPARHSGSSGIPRESLDRPLNELRAAELVRVVDWIRGVGQGYVLTEDGRAALFGRPRPPEPEPLPQIEPTPIPIVERPPIITPALVYANLLWYFVGMVIASRQGISLRAYLLEGDRSILIRLGAVSPPELIAGEWWRLATSCFVHGSIWHLMVNVASLVMVGAVAEHLWGRWRTFALYLISGFAGSCLAAGHYPVVLVGASGALCGLVLSVLAWVLLNLRFLDRDVAADLLRRLGLGIVLTLAVSLLPGVSWEAHLGGAVAGFLLAILMNEAHLRSGWRRAVSILAISAMPAACMGGLILAIRHAPGWAPFRSSPPITVYVHSDPVSLIHSLRPESTRPAIFAATSMLMTDPKRWKPERAKEVREDVGALWIHAVEISKRLEQPTGDAAEDAKRAREKGFVDARIRALSKLLEMLDRKELPTVETWKEWGTRDAEANRLWNALTVPQ